MRYLLGSITALNTTQSPQPILIGPQPTLEMCVEIRGEEGKENESIRRDALLIALEQGAWRERMGAFSLWGAMRPGWPYFRILPGARVPAEFRILTISLPLAELPGDNLTEMVHRVDQLLYSTEEWASLLHRRALMTEPPRETALKAARLIGLKERFARSMEMRLVATSRPYDLRSVWRGVYSLGFLWGNLDLFYWHDPIKQTPLFTLSALGDEGYFLPERVAEGGSVPGISLSFDLPTCSVPLAVYDRMAIALVYLRDQWGGRPQTASGGVLDGEGLEESRGALEFLVREMEAAGIAPGSPEAARLF